ncbi:hypothetical protein SAMN04488057_11937 [Cyclobacterium lianum]|uniref:Uncharacterized protein n=1 Tax=Cyclobacterium lianum TaxID=388280 RepID=A0A1M7QKB4_9BACT|nr:hypothetical protein SAMN04488057_11937 [Cyclobacterium lianum]
MSAGQTKNRGAQEACGRKDFFVLIFWYFFIKACPEQRSESGEKVQRIRGLPDDVKI